MCVCVCVSECVCVCVYEYRGRPCDHPHDVLVGGEMTLRMYSENTEPTLQM